MNAGVNVICDTIKLALPLFILHNSVHVCGVIQYMDAAVVYSLYDPIIHVTCVYPLHCIANHLSYHCHV